MAPSMRPRLTPKASRKPKTRGRITRGRIIPATRISARTHVWNGLAEHIAAVDARAAIGTMGRGCGSPSTTPQPPTPTDLPDDMGIFLASSTDDILPTEFRVPRWDCIDFGALRRAFNKKFHIKGTSTLHLGKEQLKQSKKWTAADVGLKEGDTIDVQFWTR
ncbi:hypothetical protein CcaverHIS002_0403070 [Cutaneotrichosporon cavernicola]|uniref:Uncharacterized protein n=1 Tax=Cutaneotrichosporon cavernicola TaxID=279322 RepID=A0AA48L3X6_9TREE|nr:uncharacterized protein CcaverHIS019_0403030 [Cutaneotrichosporon cavernicola]BEI83703.1 hypothetical protein CcaverHIS002_0403070 [Cutaneotrichosporon cavernicola]BEI91483.1 hypothetical protein CcaverHIS019_0403030 [Cutaneotrichosporon cavernicola]BEI99258.1 hypothetical protein CcaverHIS631_0403010 [Cutaneotrichosporon cavernicola]BEJ07035.1 hypothetical protein CcaverHIS641_0403040 [Cutaneotrichosporon cavernicola]